MYYFASRLGIRLRRFLFLPTVQVRVQQRRRQLAMLWGGKETHKTQKPKSKSSATGILLPAWKIAICSLFLSHRSIFHVPWHV